MSFPFVGLLCLLQSQLAKLDWTPLRVGDSLPGSGWLLAPDAPAPEVLVVVVLGDAPGVALDDGFGEVDEVGVTVGVGLASNDDVNASPWDFFVELFFFDEPVALWDAFAVGVSVVLTDGDVVTAGVGA